ncbi:metallophosphoesterase [Jeotgalibacillus sp. ET6]|uniref:metallophosphoesterase n=1 Tax=Jeotgalibacillus sp. ET6 TaxID=3037260 RepID=UPI0024185983|nr:metallophosphoesterase [Jeotgalibacillus sp. ET6]MDG5470990.1 metallophosphoesterase [Jeotgalibacillus sp. ET6]
MKILAVSDNHGDRERIVELKERYKDSVDVMLHCGDSELPFDSPEMEGFERVRGNCDMDSAYPDEKVVKVKGTTLFVTHGHLYGIKQSLDKIHYKASEEEAEIAFFGHSHSLGAEVIDQRLYINPGSILLPRDRKEASYAIVEKNEDEVSVHFYDELHNELTSWSGQLT